MCTKYKAVTEKIVFFVRLRTLVDILSIHTVETLNSYWELTRTSIKTAVCHLNEVNTCKHKSTTKYT